MSRCSSPPYRSCERGLNENTNWLIRQYIPKAQNFKELTQYDFDIVQNKLNNRPGKSLGFLSPIGFLYKSAQLPRLLHLILESAKCFFVCQNHKINSSPFLAFFS